VKRRTAGPGPGGKSPDLSPPRDRGVRPSGHAGGGSVAEAFTQLTKIAAAIS